MASRSFTRALRTPLARQWAAPIVQRRTLVSALGGLRAGLPNALKSGVAGPVQQVRGVKTIDFAGSKETVYGLCKPLKYGLRVH